MIWKINAISARAKGQKTGLPFEPNFGFVDYAEEKPKPKPDLKQLSLDFNKPKPKREPNPKVLLIQALMRLTAYALIAFLATAMFIRAHL
jgi:hypothetical protein